MYPYNLQPKRQVAWGLDYQKLINSNWLGILTWATTLQAWTLAFCEPWLSVNFCLSAQEKEQTLEQKAWFKAGYSRLQLESPSSSPPARVPIAWGKDFVALSSSCSSPLAYSPTSLVGPWKCRWTAPLLWRRQEQHTLGWATTKTQGKSSSHSEAVVYPMMTNVYNDKYIFY